MIALLDANLFVPTWIIDPLLSLAEAGLCEPAWSARVMDEARLAIMEVRHVPDVRARGFLDAICRAFPMAMAEDWERFEPDVNLSDPNDGHVVAAARRAGAETIVTFNLKDFPADELSRYGLHAQSPDVFLTSVFDAHPEEAMDAMRRLVSSKRHPPRTMSEEIRAFARLAPSAVRTEIVRNGRLIPVICNTANHTVGAINAQSVNNR